MFHSALWKLIRLKWRGGFRQLWRSLKTLRGLVQVGFILLMMAMLELGHFPPAYLHAIGIALVIARLLHGYALSFTQYFGFGRFWGAGLTFVVLAVCGLLCLCLAFCPFW